MKLAKKKWAKTFQVKHPDMWKGWDASKQQWGGGTTNPHYLVVKSGEKGTKRAITAIEEAGEQRMPDDYVLKSECDNELKGGSKVHVLTLSD
jgi:hypothetical protein